jgi:predicted O-methyltransferase YrrM
MTSIFGDVDQYISNLFVPKDDSLDATIKNNEASGIPKWDISPNQGKLLLVLARACNARRILEIGTLGGYSTVWLAKALPEGGKLITLELDPAYAAVAQTNIKNAGLSGVVDIVVGKALDTLQSLHQQCVTPFDLIFMDADKPPYAEYLQWSLKLSRPGTIIVADNVIREGKVLDPHHPDPAVQGVQRFNKLLAATPGVTATIIQSLGAKDHDGMAIAVVNPA